MAIFLHDETSGWDSFLRENVADVESETDPDISYSRILLEEFDIAFINLYGSEPGSLTGLDLLKKVRVKDNFTPVVVFTTDESSRYIKEAYDAGCDWYFIKGMDSASEFRYLLERYAAPEVLLPRKRLRSIYNALISNTPVPVLHYEDNPVVSYRKNGKVLYLTEMPEYDRRLLEYGLSTLSKKNLADREVRKNSLNLILPFFIKGSGYLIPSLNSYLENDEPTLAGDFYENGLKLEMIELFYQADLEKHIDYMGVDRTIKNTSHSVNRYVPVDAIPDVSKTNFVCEGVEYVPIILENSYDITGCVPSTQFSHLPEMPSKFKVVRKKYFYGEDRPESLLVFDLFDEI